MLACGSPPTLTHLVDLANARQAGGTEIAPNTTDGRCNPEALRPMAVSFQRDDAARRINVVVTGPLFTAEILSIVDWQAEQRVWDYGCLYDERQMTVPPRIVDVSAIAHYVRELTKVYGPRGPVAVVGERVGSVDAYARLSRNIGFTFQVFDEVSDAERWLASRAPQP